MIQLPPTRDAITSDEVKQIRASLGLSQAQFGKVLGLAAKTIQAYEGNRLRPSPDTEARMRRMVAPPELRRHHMRQAIEEAITLADDFRNMTSDEGEQDFYEEVQIELNKAWRLVK